MDMNGGWIHDQKAIDEIMESTDQPYFFQAGNVLTSTGRGKRALLFQNFEKLGVSFPGPIQASVGDCVSQATSLSLDTLKVTEIVLGERERWVGRSACEFFYHTSRVVVGQNRIRGDGSINAWAAKAVHLYGSLRRQNYGVVDLSVYSPARARQWGSSKIDVKLFEEAKPHNITRFAAIKNFGEACDSLYNGYPIIVASSQGFTSKRDSEGFCAPSGSWMHSMAVLGYKDDDRRPGVMIANSWPSYLPGSNSFGLPPSCFWCDASVFDRLCKFNDTFSFAGFEGFKLQADARII